MQRAPFLFTVPSGMSPLPDFTIKLICGDFRFFSKIGSNHAALSFLVESTNDRANGICALQAGLGHLMVRAHSHARTVNCSPGLRPCFFRSGCSASISFVIVTGG